MKRLALQAATVLATLAAAALLWQFREAVLLLALALVTVATLRPLVDLLVARKVQRTLALGITYATVLLGWAVVALMLGVPLLAETQAAADALMRAYDSANGSTVLDGLLVERLPASADLYRALGSDATSGAHAVLGLTMSALGFFGRGVFVLVMGVYWLGNRDAFEHWGLSLLPSGSRVRARETWRAVKAALGAHVRFQLARGAVAVIVLDAGFHALGLHYPTLPATAGGLAAFVPVLGVPFAVLAAAGAGLMDSPLQAAAAGLLAASTFTLIAAVAARTPRPRGHNRIVEIVAMMALFDAFGVAGLFAAAPLAAALHILGERLLFSAHPVVSTDLGDVARRLAALRARIDRSGKPASADLEGVVLRLEHLVASSRRLVSAQ